MSNLMLGKNLIRELIKSGLSDAGTRKAIAEAMQKTYGSGEIQVSETSYEYRRRTNVSPMLYQNVKFKISDLSNIQEELSKLEGLLLEEGPNNELNKNQENLEDIFARLLLDIIK